LNSRHHSLSRLQAKSDDELQQKYTSKIRSSTQTDAISQLYRDTNISALDQTTRNSFILLLTSQFILFLGVGAVIPVIPIYCQSIGLSATSNGIVISAPALALLLCSRFSASFADTARKPAMIFGMAVICISDLGTGFANSLLTLVVARLGLGLGRGYAEAGERGLLADLAKKAPEDWRGRGLALQQACTAVGIACGASVGGILVEEYGVRSGFICVSVAAAICLGLYTLLPETVAEDCDTTVDGENTTPCKASKSESSENEAGWIQLLTTSDTWRSLALCQCGTSFGYACKIAIIPVIAAKELPGGIAQAGLLLSAAGLAGIIGASLGGYVTDQLGSRFSACAAGLLSGLSFVLIPFALSLNHSTGFASLPGSTDLGSGPASFVTLVILWSIGASAQGPALVALAQQQAPIGREATAIGLPRAFGDGTYIIAPLVLGFASDVGGDHIPGVACAVAGLAICLGSMALVQMPSKNSPMNY
jgi:MFS family permease